MAEDTTMPAIITSPSETNCAKCLSKLEAQCLKCSRCSILLHLRCSDLPLYMLLRYKTSQSAYVCRACVLGEGDPDSLKEAEEAIKQLLEKEEKSIKETAVDANASIDQMLSETSNAADNKTMDKDQEKNSSSQEEKSASLPTCKFFLRGSCKHGKKGTNCSFRHPPLCFKFINKGDRSGGCKKGKECNYSHPRMCWSFKTDKVCRRQNCNFYHSKGTTMGGFTLTTGSSNLPTTAPSESSPTMMRTERTATPIERPPQNVEKTYASAVYSSNLDF